MAKSFNWNRFGAKSRQFQTESREAPADVQSAFRVLAFYLKEYDVDTRFIVAIPKAWTTMSPEQLIPYFATHRSGKCKALKKLDRAQWCRISRATAESVRIKECPLCSPYVD